MMSSPDYLKSEYEKMSYEELLEKREDLLAYIKRFEAGEIDDDEWHICPSPDVRYQMNLEYLGVLASIIAKKYRMRTVDWFDDDSPEMCPGNPGISE